MRTLTGYPELPLAAAVDVNNLAFRAELLSAEKHCPDVVPGPFPLEKVSAAGADGDDEVLKLCGCHSENQYAASMPNKNCLLYTSPSPRD